MCIGDSVKGRERRLRGHVALPEDSSSIPNKGLTTICSSTWRKYYKTTERRVPHGGQKPTAVSALSPPTTSPGTPAPLRPEHRLHPHCPKEKRSVCSRLGWAGCQNHNSACMVQTEAQRGSTPARSYPVSEGASWGSLPGHPFIHIPGTAATHPECQSHRGVGVLDATWTSEVLDTAWGSRPCYTSTLVFS